MKFDYVTNYWPVSAFGLGGLISSSISSTIGTTAVMGSSIPKTLASWFSNFWGGFANFFWGVGLLSGKTILTNSTSIILPILSGTAVWYTIKINKKSAQKNVENGVKINDDNVINVDVDISNETKKNKINTEIERKMIHVLSKYGKSKKIVMLTWMKIWLVTLTPKRLMKLKMKKILRKHKLTKMKQTIKK